MSERKNHGCMCTWIVNSVSGLSDDRTLEPCGLHAAWARSSASPRLATFKAKVDGVTASGRVTIEIDGRLDRSWPGAAPGAAPSTEDPKSITGGQAIDFYVHDVKAWSALLGEEFALTIEKKP